jgi:hypothetical protein
MQNSCLTISIGYYRLIGMVYTNCSYQLVQFKEHGDTYYLQQLQADIDDMSLGTSQKAYTLSVPIGIPVEAFGRCVANSEVHIFDPAVSPAVPTSFPTTPGYDTSTNLSPQTAFPYRVYTNQSGKIAAQASGASTTLQCMTDCWLWQRAP